MTDSSWDKLAPRQGVEELREEFGFDFTALGFASEEAGPLRWVYVSGASDLRYRRIALSPGSGIGGTVLDNGKQMVVLDIDREIDPREYSSYPIVFAENLRSFCALPLMKGPAVKAVLLCAFRCTSPQHDELYHRMSQRIAKGFCGFEVRALEPGKEYCARGEIVRDAHNGYGAAIEDIDPYRVLSNRELQVFELLAAGYTNKEIAEKLFVSVKTIETHRSKIYQKMGIKTRAELVRSAVAHHLLKV